MKFFTFGSEFKRHPPHVYNVRINYVTPESDHNVYLQSGLLDVSFGCAVHS